MLGKFARSDVMLVYLCKLRIAHIILLRKLTDAYVPAVHIPYAQHRTADKLFYRYLAYIRYGKLPYRFIVIIYRELVLCGGKMPVCVFSLFVYVKRQGKAHAVNIHAFRY